MPAHNTTTTRSQWARSCEIATATTSKPLSSTMKTKASTKRHVQVVILWNKWVKTPRDSQRFDKFSLESACNTNIRDSNSTEPYTEYDDYNDDGRIAFDFESVNYRNTNTIAEPGNHTDTDDSGIDEGHIDADNFEELYSIAVKKVMDMQQNTVANSTAVRQNDSLQIKWDGLESLNITKLATLFSPSECPSVNLIEESTIEKVETNASPPPSPPAAAPMPVPDLESTISLTEKHREQTPPLSRPSSPTRVRISPDRSQQSPLNTACKCKQSKSKHHHRFNGTRTPQKLKL